MRLCQLFMKSAQSRSLHLQQCGLVQKKSVSVINNGSLESCGGFPAETTAPLLFILVLYYFCSVGDIFKQDRCPPINTEVAYFICATKGWQFFYSARFWLYCKKKTQKTQAYARILCVDFRSAVNTSITEILTFKLSQLNVSPALCWWSSNFLTNSSQQCQKLCCFGQKV